MKKGFTLIEMIIVISVVIILSLISVPMYQNHTRDAIFSEGYALLGQIRDAQLLYNYKYGNFFCGGRFGYLTSNDPVLKINGKLNKYFTTFCTGYTADKYYFMAWARIPDRALQQSYNTLLMLQYNLTGKSQYSIRGY